jgi:hypothetical protein
MRKHEVKKIHLEITNVEFFKNDHDQGMIISWASDIGWGEYTFYKSKDSEQWNIESEAMDANDDKEFGQELLHLWLNECNVVS